jgi:hypothetical protein
MKKEQVLNLIAESFGEMKESGMIWKDVAFDSETILLGKESPLDSIGFVTFLTDLEERIVKAMKIDLFLKIEQISKININNPRLSVNDLANYIVELCADKSMI